MFDVGSWGSDNHTPLTRGLNSTTRAWPTSPGSWRISMSTLLSKDDPRNGTHKKHLRPPSSLSNGPQQRRPRCRKVQPPPQRETACCSVCRLSCGRRKKPKKPEKLRCRMSWRRCRRTCSPLKPRGGRKSPNEAWRPWRRLAEM